MTVEGSSADTRQPWPTRIHQIKSLLTLFRCSFETLEENKNLLQGIPNGKLQQQYGVATLSVGPPKALLFLVFRFKNGRVERPQPKYSAVCPAPQMEPRMSALEACERFRHLAKGFLLDMALL